MKSLPGDPLGTHRVLAPRGALPQPAETLDATGGTRLRERDHRRRRDAEHRRCQLPPDGGGVGRRPRRRRPSGAGDGAPPRKAAQPGHRLGRDAARHRAPRRRAGPRTGASAPGDRVATLASLSLTPLALDRVRAVRPALGAGRRRGHRLRLRVGPAGAACRTTCPERLALAVLDVAGAAPQVARLCHPGETVVVLGAGGKIGAALRGGGEAARRAGGPRHRPRGPPALRRGSAPSGPLRPRCRGGRARPGRGARRRASPLHGRTQAPTSRCPASTSPASSSPPSWRRGTGARSTTSP